MLTVLHRGPDGSERIFEAESVTRFCADASNGPTYGECPPQGQICASGVAGHPDDTVTLDISVPFGAVFVMNRHGATVARFMHPD